MTEYVSSVFHMANDTTDLWSRIMATTIFVCAAIVCACVVSVAYKLLKSIVALKDSTNVVEGVVMPFVVTPEKIERLRTEFHVRPGDVFIVSYPKSGTTWVQQIVRLVQGGASSPDTGTKITDAIPWLEGSEMPGFGCDLSLSDLEALPSPRLFKSHLPHEMIPGRPLRTSPAKYIYVARNPKDTAVSLYTFAKQLFHVSIGFTPFSWNFFLRKFLNGSLWFGDWYNHILGWWECRNEPNVLFLKYEDMQRDLPTVVMKIADFLGHKLESDKIESIARQCSFESMQSDPTSNYAWITTDLSEYFRHNPMRRFFHSTSNGPAQLMMRKGIVGDWKNYFTPQQSSKFDRLYTLKMKNSGLTFEFNGHNNVHSILKN